MVKAEDKTKTRIWIEERGCIQHNVVQLPSLPAVEVGYAEITDDIAIQLATSYWQTEHNWEKIEGILRQEYPGRQLFRGQLPTMEAEFNGIPGEYVYVLKPRRRCGKYQIEKALNSAGEED